jgi:hypothetical protein
MKHRHHGQVQRDILGLRPVRLRQHEPASLREIQPVFGLPQATPKTLEFAIGVLLVTKSEHGWPDSPCGHAPPTLRRTVSVRPRPALPLRIPALRALPHPTAPPQLKIHTSFSPAPPPARVSSRSQNLGSTEFEGEEGGGYEDVPFPLPVKPDKGYRTRGRFPSRSPEPRHFLPNPRLRQCAIICPLEACVRRHGSMRSPLLTRPPIASV